MEKVGAKTAASLFGGMGTASGRGLRIGEAAVPRPRPPPPASPRIVIFSLGRRPLRALLGAGKGLARGMGEAPQVNLQLKVLLAGRECPGDSPVAKGPGPSYWNS